ncbi:type IV pilus assembly protein FimV [Methylobacter sp. sgz302048]|uniref:type IV pilus assembly protein FimV n=1 Tax=Methylobacter sp. sgz302048 TaxID=3455945 RepID=UPI003FA09167
MIICQKLITCGEGQNDTHGFHEWNNIFPPSDSDAFSFVDNGLPDQVLRNLVFRISRKPRQLITHIQRIYYCYHANLSEQLFAALVDFLVILERRGADISRRMIIGTSSKLSREQYKSLRAFMMNEMDVALLEGNQYSIFTKGLLGTQNLVQQVISSDEQAYDPLDLARDYIEYSQLSEAKDVLENAIINEPHRLELHQSLLELYKSTQDISGLKKMVEFFASLNIPKPDGWDELMTLFMSASNER